ncbi:DcaP family trimeric outer membrane transporter [Acinetobacter sp.]|jgi:opacity protein-like surface antigen|uniref:DcaP family trimeric outer membrane transporter n=1 Tax=Acinetobacter sp. TaxID=472 RepID=UPI0035B32CF4
MNTQFLNFMLKPLALACAIALPIVTHAAPASEAEVEQLRAEIKALKSMMQQYMQQQNSLSNNLAEVKAKSETAAAPGPGLKAEGLSLKTKGGAEFSLYGNIRADALYQAEGGSLPRLYNQISSVPLEGNGESSDRLKSTLAATRLGLDFKTPTQAGDVGGKLEVDFLGANDGLRIRHAYLTYGDWLIGQTWSNFAVPDYMPETIDALGYVGGAVKRTPQVRYTYKFAPATNLVLAAEDSKDDSSNMRLPALTARLNHKFSDTFAISARAMGSEKKTDADTETAWGVGLGAKLDLTDKTMVKADYYHVKGDSSFVSWTNPGFVTNANKDIIASNEFDSITLGITQQFNSQWRGTLGYGYMKADDNAGYINAFADKTKINENLWQAWANVFYSPTKPISLGLEYVYGEREAFGAAPNGSTKGEDNRLNAVAMYNF